MEAGGAWSVPFHAARATRSHAPACAAPVVPPYTALAGALYANGYDQTPEYFQQDTRMRCNLYPVHYRLDLYEVLNSLTTNYN